MTVTAEDYDHSRNNNNNNNNETNENDNNMTNSINTTSGTGGTSSSSSTPSLSSSLLRVLCLHDERSNSYELSRKLDSLGERLYQKHGIDLVFVDGPLVVNTNTTNNIGIIKRAHHLPEEKMATVGATVIHCERGGRRKIKRMFE